MSAAINAAVDSRGVDRSASRHLGWRIREIERIDRPMRDNSRALARDLRRRERICLKQADQCVVPEARSALLGLAGNYRTVAESIERGIAAEKLRQSQRG